MLDAPTLDWIAQPWGLSNIEWAAIPLRIALGLIFVDAGFGKWSRGIRGTGDWMGGLGIPFPHLAAPAVATLELVGGLLLLMGLLVSWIAIPMAISMLVAAYISKVKLQMPFQGGERQGYELNVILVAGLVALVMLGAGPLSLDSFFD